LEKKYDIDFEFSSSFKINGLNSHKQREKLKPKFIENCDFDFENVKPRNVQSNEKIPELFAIYEIIYQYRDRNILEIKYILNVKIPPKEYLEFSISIKEESLVNNLFLYQFLSWSKGFYFEMDFGDEFETKIEEVLIGARPIYEKSDKKLRYDDWIMPHSSISASWRKIK